MEVLYEHISGKALIYGFVSGADWKNLNLLLE